MLNGELRAKLFSVIHGAVFVDAGNVWTAKTDTSRMGSRFRLGNAFNEFAVGGGVGLRVDASIFVIRFDLATPFKNPGYRQVSAGYLTRLTLETPPGANKILS